MTTALKRILKHTLILSASFIFCFFWVKSEITSTYTLQLTAFFILSYFIFQAVAKKNPYLLKFKILINVSILSLIVFLLVFSTGTLFSPLFFLMYFLLFGVSLLFEPESAITLSLVAGIFFLFTPKKNFLNEILQLSSLVIISPLAVIFGKQYLKLLQSESKIKILETEGKALEEEVVRQEKEVKNWTSNILSQKLVQIQKRLNAVLKDENISDLEKKELKDIFFQIYQVFTSGKEMEKKVEE
ncbi:hypothetical protein KJ570_03980 [Patescibacteria group bacterium]|nr:hypothetical protein [Patescibacteria group bacterium]MBU2035851.1 hypothetical protein [Patescibacteria group bacterium]